MSERNLIKKTSRSLLGIRSSGSSANLLIPQLDFTYLGDTNHVFGVPLEEAVADEEREYSSTLPLRRIPLCLDLTVTLLHNRQAELNGEILVEASPSQTRVIDISHKMESGDFRLSPDEDISVLCGLLKLYLRKLPEPLIPVEHYKLFLNEVKNEKKPTAIKNIKKSLQSQPKVNVLATQRVLTLLSLVVGSWWTEEEQVAIIAKEFAWYFLRDKRQNLEEYEVSAKHEKKAITTTMFLINNCVDIYGIFDNEPSKVAFLTHMGESLVSPRLSFDEPNIGRRSLSRSISARGTGNNRQAIEQVRANTAHNRQLQKLKASLSVARKALNEEKEAHAKTKRQLEKMIIIYGELEESSEEILVIPDMTITRDPDDKPKKKKKNRESPRVSTSSRKKKSSKNSESTDRKKRSGAESPKRKRKKSRTNSPRIRDEEGKKRRTKNRGSDSVESPKRKKNDSRES
eukprot:TRINITY_DN1237_c0_g1_i4.p1 TRINITY_DN1237_c0_g1~~TRINITY_DN1237_c0_g1_i4.p1  ORF type:complete len:458 (-),score=118.84 TRINITY_DN1237_c0_g1_i4:1924-3297(-)